MSFDRSQKSFLNLSRSAGMTSSVRQHRIFKEIANRKISRSRLEEVDPLAADQVVFATGL